MDDHAAPPTDSPGLRPGYRRSQGPLPPEDLDLCRALGVRLVYDPVQIGWIPDDALDD